MLHTLHRSSAVIIALFALFHIANHGAAVAGVEAHIQLMENLRRVYRLPLVEALLVGCVLFQVCSGLYFVIRRFGERHDFFDRLQAISGCYLAFFLLVHVSAVLFGRGLLGLDTNFFYAAAGMHVFPYSLFFLPYYFLAVAAIFAHLACAAHWLLRNRLDTAVRDRVGYGMCVAGLVLSAVIITAFAGGFAEVKIPGEYLATYGQAEGTL
ncbi:hypothetical protein [Microbulbifer yueqingensis]|uniref:Uncharacterized protein n=1 Tax=Microbulbifer yueqingensis TaxID=658219 RepID=A0A1G9DGU3_9GAMM|nr:hypothetical protein [Microbulbifer yueqingensis]SDK63086.1 hypothetical protein SAMN05216212_2801 [Microbulbifer yueqingensis]